MCVFVCSMPACRVADLEGSRLLYAFLAGAFVPPARTYPARALGAHRVLEPAGGRLTHESKRGAPVALAPPCKCPKKVLTRMIALTTLATYHPASQLWLVINFTERPHTPGQAWILLRSGS